MFRYISLKYYALHCLEFDEKYSNAASKKQPFCHLTGFVNKLEKLSDRPYTGRRVILRTVHFWTDLIHFHLFSRIGREKLLQ